MEDPQEVFNTFIPDKQAFYEFLIRKRFYMPLFRCNINSIEFMDGVFRQDIPIPRMTHVHPITIADPPSKEILKKIFIEKLVEQGGLANNLLPYIRTKDVNKQWLVNMLYCVDSQCEIFESSYKAPKRPTKVKEGKQAE